MQYAGGQACIHTLHQAYYSASPRNSGKTKATIDEIKESNHMKMLKEIRRRLQLAENDEWNRLLSSHMDYNPHRKEDEKRRGHGRGVAATTRPAEGDVTSPARQHQRSVPSAGRKRPRTKQPPKKLKALLQRMSRATTTRNWKPQGKSKQNEKQGTRNDHWCGQKENPCTHSWSSTGPQRTEKQSLKSNRSSTKRAPSSCGVDSGLDQRGARTPRNESMECSTDSTT